MTSRGSSIWDTLGVSSGPRVVVVVVVDGQEGLLLLILNIRMVTIWKGGKGGLGTILLSWIYHHQDISTVVVVVVVACTVVVEGMVVAVVVVVEGAQNHRNGRDVPSLLTTRMRE